MGVFIFLLVCSLALFFYALACYVNYCIVRKFDPTSSYGENLIPIYNYYLLLKQAVSSPGVYLLAMLGIELVGYILGRALERPGPDNLLAELINGFASVIVTIMVARVWGLLAEKLGKSFWLYAILSLVPIVNFIIILILAFDGSKPLQESEPSPPPLPPAPPQA